MTKVAISLLNMYTIKNNPNYKLLNLLIYQKRVWLIKLSNNFLLSIVNYIFFFSLHNFIQLTSVARGIAVSVISWITINIGSVVINFRNEHYYHFLMFCNGENSKDFSFLEMCFFNRLNWAAFRLVHLNGLFFQVVANTNTCRIDFKK